MISWKQNITAIALSVRTGPEEMILTSLLPKKATRLQLHINYKTKRKCSVHTTKAPISSQQTNPQVARDWANKLIASWLGGWLQPTHLRWSATRRRCRLGHGGQSHQRPSADLCVVHRSWMCVWTVEVCVSRCACAKYRFVYAHMCSDTTAVPT